MKAKISRFKPLLSGLLILSLLVGGFSSLLFPNVALAATEPLRPNGDGLTTSWSKSGGTYFYENVDETTSNGDGDYIYTASLSPVDCRFGLEDNELGTISSVTVYIVCRSTSDTYKGTCKTLVYIEGSSYYGSSNSPGTTYTSYNTPYANNPKTGTAWTWSAVNGMQVGLQGTEGWDITWGDFPLRCTQLYVIVTYTVTIPVVETDECTDIGYDSATANGEIIGTGGATVTSRGFAYKELAGEDWILPTSYSDPDSAWGNEANTYDDDTGTWGPGAFTHYLNFYSDVPIYGNKIRICAASQALVPENYFDPNVTIDILPEGGSWTNIYTGTITKQTWVEKTFTADFIEGVRIKGNGGDGGDLILLYELQFYGVAAPTETSDEFVCEDGSFGAGTYSLTLTGLEEDTDYIVRAYAVNSEGTGWGECIILEVPLAAPFVDTNACDEITSTSMDGNAEILSDGGAEVTRRGFVYAEGLKYALDFNGVSDYVEIPYHEDYYSNIAAVENFEWGSDENSLSDSGGSVSWTLEIAGTSTVKIDTAQKYLGTRSARFYRDGINPAYAWFTQIAGSGYSISLWIRKGDTAQSLFAHGNGVKQIRWDCLADENIYYYNAGGTPIDTGYDIAKDTWTEFGVRNINFSAGTYSLYMNGSLIANCVMYTAAWNNNQIIIGNIAGTSEVWLDNILVGSPSTWTFETWIYREADSGTWERLLSYSDAFIYDRFFQIQNTDTVASGFVDITGTSRSVTTIDTIPLNTLVHLSTTFDGTNVKIYFDGVLKATSGSFLGKIPRNNKLPVQIGRLGYASSWYYSFEGTEDEVRIWNDARTQEEIQDYMYVELDGDEDGLVGYWKFNEGSGATVGDSTSNNNDGTITGADWVYQECDLGITEDVAEQMYYDGTSWLSALPSPIRMGARLFASGIVRGLSFPLSKFGNPTGDITFTVRALDDTILTSKVWGDASSLTTDLTWEEVEFNEPILINEWVRILVEFNTGDGTNCVRLHSSIYYGDIFPDVLFSTYCVRGWDDLDYLETAYILDINSCEDGSFSEGEYSLTIEDLTPGTWYRVMSFAVNSEGIGWGDIVVAQTLVTLLPPANVSATDGTYTNKVTITWTKAETATGYRIYEDGNLLDTLGDVASYNDTAAPAPTITPGTADASDGSSGLYVILILTGASGNNGITRTYIVTAIRGAEESEDSDPDAGYRSIGSLTYQWLCSSADSDGDYSNIEGAITVSYNDTSAPAPIITPGTADASDGTSDEYVTLELAGYSAINGTGRYYQCVLNAEGAAQQVSASDRGYRGTTTLTFQWQRSAADSNENYSNIEGAVSVSYNDTDGAEEPDGRYYQCVVSMVGAVSQTSSSNRGYIMVTVLLPGAPFALFVFIVDADTMGANWTKGYLANSTIIRIKMGTYPVSITDGEEFYVGNETGARYALNYTGINEDEQELYNLENYLYYISAWSENDEGYSTDSAQANVGNPLGIPWLIFTLGLCSYACWKRDWIRILLAICIVTFGVLAMSYDIKIGVPLIAIGTILFVVGILSRISNKGEYNIG